MSYSKFIKKLWELYHIDAHMNLRYWTMEYRLFQIIVNGKSGCSNIKTLVILGEVE